MADGARLRVIVTRPAAQASGWLESLEAHGLSVAALPLIEIAAPADASAVTAAWQRLEHCQLAVFVSPNAVEHFFARRPPGMAWPIGLSAASPGPGTTQALLAAGVPPDQLIEPAADSAQFDSEALWLRLRERDWQGCAVEIVRGDGGREWLADTLQAHGASVRFVAAYCRAAPVWQPAMQALLDQAMALPEGHLWLFSSSEAIDNLLVHWRSVSGCEGARMLPAKLRALTTHPKIARAAQRAGFEQVWQSRPSLAEVVACIQSIES